MVGLGSRAGWRNWLGLGPSQAELADRSRREERDLLLGVLREDREAARAVQRDAAQTQQELLKALSANSASVTDYFKMVMTSSQMKPTVRIMDDATEVEFERAREAAKKKREAFGFAPDAIMPTPGAAPLATPDDLSSLLSDMRREFGDL